MTSKLALIERFNPLNQISSKYHSQLESKMIIKTFKTDDLIIRKSRDEKISHFLIKGTIEVRKSFEERYTLEASDPQCEKAIESQLQNRSVIKAIEECEVLAVSNEFIDQMLTWSQDYSIFYLEEGGSSIMETDLIDDNFEEDWDNAFLQSQLAANLTNTSIHNLLSNMEDIEVSYGEQIVRRNSPADYFYIVKKGIAEVKTDKEGPFEGKVFHLVAGNYFGDEALVANTLRNADVTMKTDGVLGRVSSELFNKLIKEFLVSPITNDVYSQHQHVKVLDVRLAIEYKQKHYKDSENIPISNLRKKLQEFQQSTLYIITPENDCRSELATYLMRQAGFEAYHLPKKYDGDPVLLSL